MKASIDRKNCISCGVCPFVCAQVFSMADDDLAQVIVDEIPTNALDDALQAQEECPVAVIIIK